MSELSDLRAAAASLDAETVVDGLARTFEAWREPGSHWRRRLVREQDTYSAQVIERGIERGLESWDAEALRRLRAREIDATTRSPALTAVWLAETVPTGVFSALALPLLAGSAVYAKPPASEASRADAVSARLFAESLREASEALAAALALGDDTEVLLEADAVVAYGRDETIELLRGRVGLGTRFVGHGHKLSVAAIGPRTDIRAAAARAAEDVALYDGRGCLSPAYLLVDDIPHGRAEAFAAALCEELELLQTQLPRGPLTPAEEVAMRELRARASMGAGTSLWLSKDTTDWGVLLGPEAIRPSPGLLRNVPVVAVSGIDGLAGWCRGLAPHLSAVGQCGWGDDTPRLADIAFSGGGSRVCALGRMQLPPIDWNQDGVGPLRALLSAIDVELSSRSGVSS